MSTAFMVHGAYGNSRNHWFQWTRFTLEDCGFTVIAPDFPTPEGQSLENWMKVYSDLSLQFDSESIFIGHSLGVPFLLNILQSLSKPIKAAYFVGGLYKNIDMQEFDPINCTFYQDGFDWDLIKANCGSFTIFHANLGNEDNGAVGLGNNRRKLTECLAH